MRQITSSNPQRGTVHRDVNRADAALHAGAYATTSINSNCGVDASLPRAGGVSCFAALTRLAFPLHAGPSSLPRGSHEAAPDRPPRRNRERGRHEGATLQAQGGLVASAGANEGGRTAQRGERKASRHSLPSDLRQAQDKEAGGARLSCLCCGGSDGIRPIAKHTRVTVCSFASIVSPSCERRPCRDFCARAGSVGRLAGAASSTRLVTRRTAQAEGTRRGRRDRAEWRSEGASPTHRGGQP